MAGIEITDEMTSEQLEAMTGGEQLKAEVCAPQNCFHFPEHTLYLFGFFRICVTTCPVGPLTDRTVSLPNREAISARSGTPRSHPSG